MSPTRWRADFLTGVTPCALYAGRKIPGRRGFGRAGAIDAARNQFLLQRVVNYAMAAKSLYDDLVMDHIKNARNYRVPGDADRHSHGSNPLCGDDLTVYLRMNGERLDDVAFQCNCCGICMASASMMTESVAGRSALEARSRARAVIARVKAHADPAAQEGDEMLSALLATVREFPARAGCALLPWITLEAALEDPPEATLSG